MEVETECFDTFNFLDDLTKQWPIRVNWHLCQRPSVKSSGGKSICFIENSIKENWLVKKTEKESNPVIE